MRPLRRGDLKGGTAGVTHFNVDDRLLRLPVEAGGYRNNLVIARYERELSCKRSAGKLRGDRFRAVDAQRDPFHARRFQVKEYFGQLGRVADSPETASRCPGHGLERIGARFAGPEQQGLDGNTLHLGLGRRIVGFHTVRHAVCEQHDDAR
jgi:hypothetical protein